MQLEFDADASPSAMAACIEQNGVALIRGCYPVALIAQIAAACDAYFAAQDAAVARGEQPPNRFRTIPLEAIAVEGVPAHSLLMTELVRAVAGACIGTAKPAAKRQSYVRCSHPTAPDLRLPYHQDGRVLLGGDLVNCWIPLVDCGREIPGLEVVVARVPGLEPTLPGEPQANYFRAGGMEIDPDDVQRRYGPDRLWHPEFRAGDALIFLGTTIHRTHVAPGMSGGRLSIDLRLTR